ncbi:hypothetical protein D3C71_1187050 [compost metagenome]
MRNNFTFNKILGGLGNHAMLFGKVLRGYDLLMVNVLDHKAAANHFVHSYTHDY